MHLWGSLLAGVLLGLQYGVSAFALTHGQVAARDEVCIFYDIPYIEIYVFTYVTLKTVQINTYIPENTTINVNDDVTININNAPAYLVTEVVATNTVVSTLAVSSTVTNITPDVQSTTGIPISPAGIFTALGSVQTPSAAAIESEALELFILAVLPLQSVARRQAATIGFLADNGAMTPACENATIFQIRSGMLFDSTGALISVSTNTNASLLASQLTEAQIATTFSINGGVLSWTNQNFAGGASQFCRGINGKIYAVFNGVISPGCTLIALISKSTANCNALDTKSFAVATPANVLVYEPTGGSAFSGPMFTVTAGIAGSTATAVTLLPTLGGLPIGTVIYEVPIGGTAFSGPFITSTSSVAGSITTTVTLLPTFSIPTGLAASAAAVVNALLNPSALASAPTPQQTGLIIVEQPTGGPAYSGAYSTLNVAIAGTVTISYTLPPEPGASTGLVIVEIGTGGLPFSGPYVTTTSFIGGLSTSSVTIPPTSLLPSITPAASSQATAAGPTITSFVALSSGQPQFTSTIPASGTSPALVIIGTALPTSFSMLPFGSPGSTSMISASGSSGPEVLIGHPLAAIPTGLGALAAIPTGLGPLAAITTGLGLVIIEEPTGGSSFTGPYQTSIVAISGSATSTVTIAPTAGASFGVVLIEEGIGGLPYSGAYVTTTITIGGSIPSTVVIPPTFAFSAPSAPSNDDQGTVLIQDSVLASPTTAYSYTTVIQTMPNITSPVTITVPPSDGSTIGTVYVDLPPNAPSSGSLQTTFRRPPIAEQSGGSIVTDLPQSSLPTFTPSLTTETRTVAGPGGTTTLPLQSGATVQTVLVDVSGSAASTSLPSLSISYITTTIGITGSIARTQTLQPLSGGLVGTVLVQDPISFTTQTLYSGTQATTQTLLPASGGLTGTVLIQDPISFTTQTRTISGSLATTQTFLPSSGGTLGTVLVGDPIVYVTVIEYISPPAIPTTITIQPSPGSFQGTVIIKQLITYVTLTTGYGGDVLTTTTLSSSVAAGTETVLVETPTSSSPVGTVLVESPTSASQQPQTTTIFSGYSGSVVSTRTLSGSAGITIEILEPTTARQVQPVYTTIYSGYSGNVVVTSTISGGTGTFTVVIETPTSTSYTTVVSGYSGSTVQTTTLPPGPNGVVTVEILTPTTTTSSLSSSSTNPAQATSFTTVVLGYSGSTVQTTTLPPGPNRVVTVEILTPTTTTSSLGSSSTNPAQTTSFTTVILGYSGSTVQTTTLPPGPNGVVTVEILTPTTTTSSLGSSSTNPAQTTSFTTVISGYSGSIVQTTTLPQGPNGVVTVEILTPTTTTSSLSSSSTNPTQTTSFTTVVLGYSGSIVQTTTLPQGPNGVVTVEILTPTTTTSSLSSSSTNPTQTTSYTTVVSGYSGSIVQTTTLPPGPNGVVTVEIFTPTSQGFSTSTTSSPSSTSTTSVQVTSFTTLFLGYSGTMTSTVSLAPGSDGVVTVEILTPTSTSMTQSSTTSNPTSCTSYTATPTKVCETTLPSSCVGLGTGLGAGANAALSLSASVTLCSNALGIGSIGGVSGLYDPLGTIAHCLPDLATIQAQVNALSPTTAASVGVSIDSCLITALQSRCITALPQSCIDLGSASLATVIDVLTDLPACITDLGPFALDAVVCTATSVVGTIASPLLGSGQSLVTCLDDALGLEGTSTELVCTNSSGATCIGALPNVCSSLGLTDGLLLVPQVLACVEALPPAVVTELGLTVSNLGLALNNAVTAVGCIVTTVLGITIATSGQDVLNCLNSNILC